MKNRVIPLILTAALLFSLVSPCFAAAAAPTAKEEVVYVNLNPDGSVNGVYVVNILKGGGELLDYGSYTEIRNMTTPDELTLDNKVVTGRTDAEKLYYEGKLEGAQIPWNITIRYFLDGEEHTAADIAGKSGAFKLLISIRQNPRAGSVFFESYALQATVTLDTKLCKNIEAVEATVANVGSKKQLTHTLLPGIEKDISITADVTDFHMDGIAINGVRLNMSIEIDDEELLRQVNELTDAIAQIDNGANELNGGASDLMSAVRNDLQSGISSLKNGGATLDEGIAALRDGINEAQEGINRLNEASGELTDGSAQVKKALLEIQSSLSAVSSSTSRLAELLTASSQIKAGISELCAGVETLRDNLGYEQYKALLLGYGLDIDELIAGNAQAASSLSSIVSTLESIIAPLPDSLSLKAQLQAQISQLAVLVTLFDANNAAIGGTEAYLNQLSAAVDTLYDGVSELNTKYAEFDLAISFLVGTLAGLLVDLSTLRSGINELVKQYTKLDDGIREYTDGVASLAVGYSQIVDGVVSLADGSKELTNGISALHSGTDDLYNGVARLSDGTLALSDGTGEIRERTDGMDTEISDAIDTIIDSVSGGDGEIVSFASDKNTGVRSVQFVIKTEAIEEAGAVEEAAGEEAALNFWQKLLRLFGIKTK